MMSFTGGLTRTAASPYFRNPSFLFYGGGNERRLADSTAEYTGIRLAMAWQGACILRLHSRSWNASVCGAEKDESEESGQKLR